MFRICKPILCVFCRGGGGGNGSGPGLLCSQSPRGPLPCHRSRAWCMGHHRGDVPGPVQPAQSPAVGFCTPQGFSAFSRVVSVHPETSAHTTGGFHAPQGLSASPGVISVYTPRSQFIPPGGFCAPQGLGASLQRGFCAPQGWELSRVAPRVTVHFIYGVTYVILSIFLTFPEKR